VRVLLRADSGKVQGTGHVMRCLTLGDELRSRGHDVHLMTTPITVRWLASLVAASGIVVHHAAVNELPIDAIAALDLDWVVVDSYRIDPEQVSRLNKLIPVLAIIDGDDRGMDASLYLDQNLGADKAKWPPKVLDRLLAGASYSLVRDAILRERRQEPWRLHGERAAIVSFMGGTDPTGASVEVAAALIAASADAELTIVAPEELHELIEALSRGRGHLTISDPTPELPALFGRADIVVSAAGTSAWDVCALGIPAVLVAVVHNQSSSISEALAEGMVLGIDASDGRSGLTEQLTSRVVTLLTNEVVRRKLSDRCLEIFDGKGKARVSAHMEERARRT